MSSAGKGRYPLNSYYVRSRARGRRGAFYPLTKKVGVSGTASKDAFSNYFFIPVATTTGYIKVWLGSSWQLKPVKYWNGSSWIQKSIKYWNGSSWVQGSQI